MVEGGRQGEAYDSDRPPREGGAAGYAGSAAAEGGGDDYARTARVAAPRPPGAQGADDRARCVLQLRRSGTLEGRVP